MPEKCAIDNAARLARFTRDAQQLTTFLSALSEAREKVENSHFVQRFPLPSFFLGIMKKAAMYYLPFFCPNCADFAIMQPLNVKPLGGLIFQPEYRKAFEGAKIQGTIHFCVKVTYFRKNDRGIALIVN